MWLMLRIQCLITIQPEKEELLQLYVQEEPEIVSSLIKTPILQIIEQYYEEVLFIILE